MVSMCGSQPTLSPDRSGPRAPEASEPEQRLEALRRGVAAVVAAMKGEVEFANDNERAFALLRRGCHHCAKRPEDLDAVEPKDTILAFLARVSGRKSAARQLQELGAILVSSAAWREVFAAGPASLTSILAAEEQGAVAAFVEERAVRALAPPGDGARVFLREQRSLRFLTVRLAASRVEAAAAADDSADYDSPWDHCDYSSRQKASSHEVYERAATADHAECCLTEQAASLFVCSCGTRPSSAESPKPQDVEEGPLCPSGHALQPWLTSGGLCDGCGRETWRGEQVMDCRECDWYLCQSCHRSVLEKSQHRTRASSGRPSPAPAEPGAVLGFAHEGVPAPGRYLVARKPWPSSLRSALTGGRIQLELHCASKALGRHEEFRWGSDAALQHVSSGLWLYADPGRPGTVCMHDSKRSSWEALPAT